jgi:hypothetical protein
VDAFPILLATSSVVYGLGVVTALLFAVADNAWIMVAMAVSDCAMTVGNGRIG